MTIVVFGSINMDLVARVSRLPVLGETITGHSFQTFPGGKGANQAVACARLAAPTWLVGRVGDDAFGGVLKSELVAAGVNDALVASQPGVSSGVAVIAVDDAGENNIIVIPGANGQVSGEDLWRLENALEGAKVLLLQLEIPLDVVVSAARMGQGKGVLVILDPAPAKAMPDELYGLVDIITPNETEAAILVGYPVIGQDDAARAAQALLARGVGRVVIKMGSQGAYAAGESGVVFYPAIPVTVVDTVAAGDAFNGALAVALSEGKSFEEAVHWGIVGGALAVIREGAQPAMPGREELLALLQEST